MESCKSSLPRQLTIKRASEIYSIPEWTLRAYIAQGRIPYRHVGRRVYIPVEKFEAWLEKGDFVPSDG